MDLWVTLGVLARRWYLTIPMMVAAIFAAVTYADSLQPLHTAEATVRFYCPDEVRDPNDPATLIPASRLCNDRAIFDLTGDQAELLRQSGTKEFFVENGFLDDFLIDDLNPPRLTITAEGDDPDVVVGTVRFAALFIQSALEQQQADPVGRYTAEPLGELPQEAVEVPSGRIRAIITIAVAGVLLTIALVLLVDALFVYVRNRGAGGATAPAGDDAGSPIATPQGADAPWVQRRVPPPQEPGSVEDDEPSLSAVSGGRNRWGR